MLDPSQTAELLGIADNPRINPEDFIDRMHLEVRGLIDFFAWLDEYGDHRAQAVAALFIVLLRRFDGYLNAIEALLLETPD